MCPSFMVTREEMHSTRGRANALRATMTGLLPPDELTGSRLIRGHGPVYFVQRLQSRVSLGRGYGSSEA
jgi:Fe-S oxidoreductase